MGVPLSLDLCINIAAALQSDTEPDAETKAKISNAVLGALGNRLKDAHYTTMDCAARTAHLR
jgi:hypothetical protein